MGNFTTIRVSEEITDRIHSYKKRGESYNSVLERLFERLSFYKNRIKELESQIMELKGLNHIVE